MRPYSDLTYAERLQLREAIESLVSKDMPEILKCEPPGHFTLLIDNEGRCNYLSNIDKGHVPELLMAFAKDLQKQNQEELFDAIGDGLTESLESLQEKPNEQEETDSERDQPKSGS